ncbi:TonB-dependent siderophore receptor [Psychrobium sp. 1_MG-2023]|uniref:TonB-dependent receptor plug domain-containing protein n=1 Tax=Psychrobium sp. 1_MG-2023 TaxID=3062624 RepID=UPI002732803F|nr:TonB-dependent receptor [Psychrobium sp. 1_MG-2023]MDP2560425.1 TonB-dependent receptor plug domain-containing protein [Psychrobium sp. 1_MG-2023]
MLDRAIQTTLSQQAYSGASKAMTPARYFGVATLLLGLSGPVFADSNSLTQGDVDIYNAEFFMAFEPHTLRDILDNIPGANNLLIAMNNASQSRGFGSAGDQILINSKRVSGKGNNLDKELSNIKAQDVDYIELIRGSRSDLDVQSNGLIINVALKKEVESSTLWSLGAQTSSGLESKQYGSVVYSASSGDVIYRLGLTRDIDPTVITSVEQFRSPQGGLTDTEERHRRSWYQKNQLSGKLEYNYSAQTALQLNALYAQVSFDSEVASDIDDWITGDQSTKLLSYDWGKDDWEISGDITHELNQDNQLKLLFITNHTDADDKIWQTASRPSNEFQLPRLYTASEDVLRGNWKYQWDSRHSFDSGVEVAINQRDEVLKYIKQSATPYQSTELNNIKETRYEAFTHYNFAISPQLNFQSSLVYERSTMEVATDVTLTTATTSHVESQSSRRFSYLKPRINLRYDVNDIYQLRVNYERTVSQLALNDFVPWFNRFESRLEETNPDLKPEVRDELSVSVEKQWLATSGSITLTPYYHKISDLRTEVPLAVRSGDGNIDSGKEYGLKLDTSFGLDVIGLENTVISASYTWRDSEMHNPFLQHNTTLERVNKNKWNAKINQNELLPGLSFSLALTNKTPHQFYYYDYAGRVNSEMTANAYFDYRINQHFKLRLAGDSLLNNKYTVYKRRHSGHFAQTDVLRHEKRTNEFAPNYSLTLTGQF